MSSMFSPPPSPFEPASLPYRILSSPLKFLVQTLYAFILFLRGPSYQTPPPSSRIRLVCISDTHSHKPSSIPPGDVLIHAGDLTNDGTLRDIQDQIDWLNSLPHKHVIFIAGNHDSYFDPRSRKPKDRATGNNPIRFDRIHYLQHSSLKLSFSEAGDGGRVLHFYGAPQIPACGGEDFAFQYRREDDAWSGTVPEDTDVLITHTPPRHHLDMPWGVGCDFLRRETWKVKPRVHVCGHVHAGHGRENVFWDESQRVYEHLCARGEDGVLWDMIAVWAWVDVVRLLLFGVLGVLWTRVWGADDSGGIIVNAALMYRSSGQILNPPEVVDI